MHALDERGSAAIPGRTKFISKTGKGSMKQIIFMKTTGRISNGKPWVVSVSPEPSKDVFSSTKTALLVTTSKQRAAELAL